MSRCPKCQGTRVDPTTQAACDCTAPAITPAFAGMLAKVKAEMVRQPWPRESQLAYARKHAESARRFTDFPDESDVEIAGRGRMQMRDSLIHESVCTAVRDRICLLVVEKVELIEVLTEAERFLSGFEGDAMQAPVIEDLLAKVREALKLAERGQ